MRTVGLLATALLCAGSWPRGSSDGAQAQGAPVRGVDYGQVPLHFERNEGQTADPVAFLARGAGYVLFLTESGEAVLSLRGGETSGEHPVEAQSVLRVRLAGVDRHLTVEAEEPLPGKSNYLIGNDPRDWRTNVAHFGRVRYRNVYPGVDLVYYGNQTQLEYDFVLSPGANPDVVRLSFEGNQGLRIDEAGNLVVSLSGGDVVHKAPIAYQEVGGVRVPVTSRYRLDGKIARFEIGDYDRATPLVIDPILVYSTYLGGGNVVGCTAPPGGPCEAASAIAVGPEGETYVAGFTTSTDFPTVNPVQGSGGGEDAFVTKLNASGTSLVYSTYIGGSGSGIERANSLAVDAQGAVYVVGQTMSASFPAVNAFQPVFGGLQDAFIFKLAPAGSTLEYSSYLGGSDNDAGHGVAVDDEGSAYVVGYTLSTNFPTVNPFQTDQPDADMFVSKISPSGSALTYSTYLGGSGSDRGNRQDIAVGSDGSAYIVGSTNSFNFPTVNAYDGTLNDGFSNGGAEDAVVTKLAPSGSSLVYSTYLGGTTTDFGGSIAVNGAGEAYVTGFTKSDDFPTLDAWQSARAGADDAFVTKFTTTGNALVFSTFLGGVNDDSATAIAIDPGGNTSVAGYTNSIDFPTVSAYQTNQADLDGFVTKLTPTGSVVYSTYLGGSGVDAGSDLAMDAHGGVHVAGYTLSSDFPVQGDPAPFDSTLSPPGGSDGFVTLLFDRTRLAIGDTAATEGDSGTTSAVFTVITPLAAPAEEITVDYTVVAGTASAGSDYIATSGTLTFGVGVTSQTISVDVNGDTEAEGDEYFTVVLSNAVGADIVDDTGVGSILSDDEPPADVSVLDRVVAEGNSGTSPATVTLRLSRVRGVAVSVDYATVDGTARVAGDPQSADYVAASGSLTFPAFTTTQTTTIAIRGDTEAETRESFYLELSNPVNAVLGDGIAEVTINDDDSTLGTTGNLIDSRNQHTATLLLDGSVLATSGGTAERLDPGTLKWTTVASPGVNRRRHTALLLDSGKVLVAAGWSGGSATGDSELYDPQTGDWTESAALTPRADHTTTRLPDGRVLAVGGTDGTSYVDAAQVYDGAWASAGALATGRANHSATLLADGRVLVVGGAGASGLLGTAEVHGPAVGAWSAAGTLASGRSGHCATLLGDGRVLVVGGTGAGGPLASAEVYDPSSGWSVTGSLQTARQGHTCALLPTGEVLVAGGTGAGGVAVLTTETYLPATGTWSRAGAIAVPRTGPTATVLGSGRVLIAGGNASLGFTAELFDPATSRWSAVGALGNARAAHTATLLPDGRVLAVGGPGGAELFDPTATTWSPAPAPGPTVTSHTATLLPAPATGRVLVAGGTSGSTPVATATLYDADGGAWTDAQPMAVARAHHTATLLPNERVLAAGGQGTGGAARSEAEVYDYAGGSWSATGALAAARFDHTATLLPAGAVLVVGGTEGTQMLRSAELYDPLTGTWRAAATPSAPRAGHIAVLLRDGRVLVAGGLHDAGPAPLSSAEIYDPVADSWTATGSMSVGRADATATLLWSGQVLVTGGFDGAGVPASAELYEPSTGRWVKVALAGGGRQHHAAALLTSGAVLLAGGYTTDPGAPLSNGVLYDPDARTSRARPTIGSVSDAIAYGTVLTVEGTGFRGDSEAGTGTSQNSSVQVPLVELRELESGRVVSLSADAPLDLSGDPATLSVGNLPDGLDAGWHLLRVVAAGMPSTATLVPATCSVTITQDPADQVVTLGQPATFRVASAGARSYQWYRDGLAIPGATGATYTTPPASAADVGTAYRAEARGACWRPSAQCTPDSGTACALSEAARLLVEDAAAPTASVVSPSGGEYWLLSQSGQPPSAQVVIWSMSDDVRVCSVEVSLWYSNDGGVSYQQASAAGGLPASFGPGGTCPHPGEATTSVTYTVPTSFPSGVAGSLYKVQVRVIDQAGNATDVGSANPFYIVQSNPDSVRTLILHNVPRMQARMGISGAQAAALRTKLAELANHPRVQGLLVDLSTRTELGELYTVWDDAYTSDPSSAEDKANNVLFGCHPPYPAGCPTDVDRDGVHDVVRELVRIYSGAKYLVIVGDDRIVPLARLTDRTSLFPESHYTGPGLDLTETGTTVGRALGANKYLSDDPLSVLDAVSAGELGGSLFVPDLAVGRLVERPEEITTTIATFISQEGVVDLSALDPTSGHKVLVESYDFLSDAGKQIRRRWKSALGATTPDDSLAPVDGSLMEGNWGLSTVEERRAELREHLSGNGGSRYAVMSLNGHATHFEEGVPGTSAQDIEGLGSWDIYGPEPVVCEPPTPSLGSLSLAGAVAYGVGCHGGLPVAGSCGSDADHSLDLPQTMLARGVVAYVANTGYGWGLKSGIGYGERLVQVFSEELSKGGTVVVGDAVKRAKARYLLETPRLDAYDEKSLMQWTLFGLPMYAVATGIGNESAGLRSPRSLEQVPQREQVGKAIAEAREPKASLPAFLTQLSLHFDFTAPGVYTKRSAAGDDLCPVGGEPCPSGCPDPQGCYYTLNGLVERATGAADIPVQPYFIYDSRLSGTSQHGVLWKGGIYDEEDEWVPVMAELASNGGDASDHGNAPRTIVISTISPRLVPGSDPAQCRPSDLELSSLVVSAGEALKDQESDLTYSIQRRYREIDLEAFYFNDTATPANNCDREGPALGTGPFGGEYHEVAGSAVNWSVPASDPAGVWRVLVVFNANSVDGDGRGVWEPIELAFDAGSGTWKGSRSAAGRVTYVIQAVDKRGNVTWQRFVSAQLPASGVPLGVARTVDAVVDPAPTAVGDSYSATAGATLSVSAPGVLGNDSSPQGSLSAVLMSSPAHGTFSFQSDGSFTYTPDPDWRGADSFTYRASNEQAQSATATVTLTVGASTDLAIDMEGARTGRQVAFTITVSNDGPSQATGVTVTDSVPGAASMRSVSPSQGSCSVSGAARRPGMVTCTLGTMAPAASATVQLTLTMPRRLTTNTASVSGVESDPDGSNNTTQEQLRIGLLRVDPQAVQQRLEYGDSVGHTSLSLHNPGQETLDVRIHQADRSCTSERARCEVSWLWLAPATDLLASDARGTVELGFSAERLAPGLRRTWLGITDEVGAELAAVPICFTVGFTDVPPGSVGDEAIHALAGEGISGGCRPGRFCPQALLTRREAAVWLLRAKEGRRYEPPPAEGAFADVAPESFGASAIEELARRGIVMGCAEGRYCPDQPITGGQMALLLLRALGRGGEAATSSTLAGDADGYRATDALTRAGAADMLVRALARQGCVNPSVSR